MKLSLAAAMALTGASCSAAPATTPVGAESTPGLMTLAYTTTTEPIINPERGFYTSIDLPFTSDLASVRARGNSLIRIYVRLDDWRESDLPQTLLDDLDVFFARVRQAGLKIVLRFSYNFGPYPDSEPDASKQWMFRHMDQLKPFLAKNYDVITWVEAGFIGAWGEWHTSTNGLDTSDMDKGEILDKLLDTLPADRMVQLRYPSDLIKLMGAEPVTEAEAFSGSNKARVGHHNDCFLASDDDQGTYSRGGGSREEYQAYLSELGRFTPIGGETCAANPPRTDCETALREMALLHFSEINESYHPQTLGYWKKQGCYEEISQRLGYQLTLQSATMTPQVKPGGELSLTVTLTNTGFAAPINPRAVVVALDGPQRYTVTLDSVDPRRWEAGQTATFSVRLRLPADAPTGSYRLALWLPDPTATLRDDPRYAVRFANVDVWDNATGFNVLTNNLVVDANAPGSSDANAAQFSVIP